MATLTTTTADFAWRPDESTFAPADVIPQALLLQTATISGEINGDQPSLHVAFVTDAESAAYVAEAAAITDSEPGLDEVLVRTRKISRLVSLSNEQFSQEGTAGQVSASGGGL